MRAISSSKVRKPAGATLRRLKACPHGCAYRSSAAASPLEQIVGEVRQTLVFNERPFHHLMLAQVLARSTVGIAPHSPQANPPGGSELQTAPTQSVHMYLAERSSFTTSPHEAFVRELRHAHS